MDSLAEHIAVIDEKGTIIVVNDAWRKFAEGNGVAASTVSEGSNYLAACDRAAQTGDMVAGTIAALIRDVAKGTRATAEIEYPCHSPTEERWFHLKISRFRDDGPVRVVIAHENITARHKSDQRIEYLATHDALTGLPNRRLFQDRAQQAFEHCQRAKLGAAILFIDLDNFKFVNDAYGHAIGDEVLVYIARLLAGMVRSGDTISRFGGDELVVLLTDLRNPAMNANKIVRAMIQKLESPLLIDGREITVTASIGISIFPDDAQNLEELLRNADAAMYRAKAVGRSGHQFYAPEMSARANERVLLEKELRRAVRRNELTVAYQPQVSLSTGLTIGVEALARWTHPELGPIAPSRFIPIAEETGLITDLGRFVLMTACSDAASWGRAGLPRVPVAVNVSTVQVWQSDFVDSVDSTVAICGLDPSMLELEITEGIMMDRGEDIAAQIGELRRLGVSLAIDDFGTGYSNLRYLKAFSPSRLKIDRWFVEGLLKDPNAIAITRAIVALGDSLGLRVLAEGVETQDQARILRDIGCEEAQGFLYSGALSADEIESRLRAESEPRSIQAGH
jgi:diguanylate cyclase (GGDEF)-like protein